MQIFRGLIESELSERESYIYFDAESAQTHKVVNDLARVRAVIEQSRLQHHFLGVKTDPFVRGRRVVMTSNRVLMFPGKTKLKIVTGNSFMNADRSRILRGRAPEVTEIWRRLRQVTDAVGV